MYIKLSFNKHTIFIWTNLFPYYWLTCLIYTNSTVFHLQ